MADVYYTGISELKPGDILGQDILVGTQVLLTQGTVLNEAQIARLSRLNLRAVALRQPSGASDAPAEQSAAAGMSEGIVPVLSFRDIAAPEEPTWLADASFSQEVKQPPLEEQEKFFRQMKDSLREASGMKPLLPSQEEQRFSQELQASFISAALRKQVDLQQISGLASELTEKLRENSGGYLSYVDIEQYGQFLAQRTLLSGKVFFQVYAAESNGWIKDHLRSQFALASACTLLPQGLATSDPSDENEEQREMRKRAFLKILAWLRDSGMIQAEVLSQIEYQYERVDGKGIPYGVSGDQVPFFSQGWSISNTYSHQLLSQPSRARKSPRQAGDFIVAQSGRAYSSKAVNQFLRIAGYYPSGSLVELNDGTLALVHAQNALALLKPTVLPVYPDGKLGAAIDLTQRSDLYIQRSILEH